MSLEPADVAAVMALARAATASDGVEPLSEQALLRLRYRKAHADRIARDGAVTVGYAQVDLEAEPPTAEIVVHPDLRERGHGGALTDWALECTGGALAAWAHGNLPGAQSLATHRNFVRQRVLHRMRRALPATFPAYDLPAGVRLRPFIPGVDDDAWIAVNARAFATHPEQGRMTVTDLHERMAEPWFDPAGFILAERASAPGGARVVGYHWTKIHPDGTGEVYVIGLDPDEQGSGLAKPLLVAGLAHLRAKGARSVILFVEADNDRAVGLYTRLGFDVDRDDVLYVRDTSSVPAVPEPKRRRKRGQP